MKAPTGQSGTQLLKARQRPHVEILGDALGERSYGLARLGSIGFARAGKVVGCLGHEPPAELAVETVRASCLQPPERVAGPAGQLVRLGGHLDLEWSHRQRHEDPAEGVVAERRHRRLCPAPGTGTPVAQERPHDAVTVAEHVCGDDERVSDDRLRRESAAVDDRRHGFHDHFGLRRGQAALAGRGLGHRAECYWPIGATWRCWPQLSTHRLPRCPPPTRSMRRKTSLPRRPRLGALDRRIIALAVPALGALLVEPLYNLTDSAIVGHLGRAPLARSPSPGEPSLSSGGRQPSSRWRP